MYASSKRARVRDIPSAVLGESPLIVELVPSTMMALSGEIWAGRGNVRLTGASEFAPLHRMPVVETLGAAMVLNARLRLTAPTKTYPL